MRLLKSLKERLIFSGKNFIGVDIGTREIKVVEATIGKLPEIVNMGRIPTPQGAIEDGAIIQIAPVAEALRTCLFQSEIKTGRAATIVSGKNVITRFIKLPRMTSREIHSTLKWEADKYIPLSTGTDLVMDHIIVGEAGDESIAQLNVLLVAVPRSLVYRIYDTFTRAGLELAAIEIEALSLWRNLGQNISIPAGQPKIKNNTFIGVDIGAKASNLTVFQQENLLFSRFISFGGDFITERIAVSLDLDFNAAQLLKERDGELVLEDNLKTVSPDQLHMDQVLKEGLLPLVDEIRRSLEFFHSQFKNYEPKALVISGGTAKLKGLADFLQNEIGLPVVREMQNVNVGEQVAPFSYYGVPNMDPAFAVARGLALREVVG